MSIAVSNLSKAFGATAVVSDISFEIGQGELVALLGPSGSGKSTVLRIIAGLETPDAGSIFLGGQDATHTRVQERGIGFVFQNYALFKHMNVHENIAFGLSVRKTPRAEIQKLVAEMLLRMQLVGLEKRYPSQLSGGQRQRVALARALAPKPKLLLLDEPFGALDAKVRLELREWIRRLHKQHDITTVFVTHDQEEAMDLADRVIVLHRGKIEQIGTPEEIYDKPATEFVASFVGSINVLQGQIIGDSAHLGPLKVQAIKGADHGTSVRAFIRPHDIELSSSRAEPAEQNSGSPSNRTFASAQIERMVRVGWLVKMELRLPDGQNLSVEVSKERVAELQLVVGDSVFVHLKNAKVFVQEKPSGVVLPEVFEQDFVI